MEIKTNCIVDRNNFICVDAYHYDQCSFGISGDHMKCARNIGDNCTYVIAMKYGALEQMEFLKKWLNKNKG